MGSLGKEVRRLREERGLTGAQLAARAGLAPSAVSQIETGKRTPHSTSVVKLAEALEVEVSELYPKAQAPLPLEDFAELTGRAFDYHLERAVETPERRYLIPLLDSYTLIMSELYKGHTARIANLSEDLPPETVFAVYQWVREFLYNCDLIEYALDEKGVMEAAISLIDRAQAGDGNVPDDLVQKARDFQRAWSELTVDAWTAANDWVNAQFARPEVMEFSRMKKREADKRREKASNVVYLDDWKPKSEKSAHAWDTPAGSVG